MALTDQQKTAVRALLRTAGGIDAVIEEIRTLDVGDRRDVVITALNAVLSLSVSDWTIVRTTVASVPSSALYPVMQAIDTAIESGNATLLGPLLIAMYGAGKKLRGQP